MNLSFFTHPDSIKGSAEIRGRQVAEHLGARLNPTKDYEKDVCVYVKMQPPEDFPEHSYFDVVDNRWVIPWIKKHPDMGVIAISKTARRFLHQELGRTDIHLIPEHHCNFERKQRNRKDVTVVGYMGSRMNSCFPADMKDLLARVGLDFLYNNQYKTRQDVVQFYNSIDIQLLTKYPTRKGLGLKNPLKLCNASSFGIPTVGFPEACFVEEFDCFLKARNIDETIAQCLRLKNEKNLYTELADDALLRAEEYHIDRIANLYRNLK